MPYENWDHDGDSYVGRRTELEGVSPNDLHKVRKFYEDYQSWFLNNPLWRPKPDSTNEKFYALSEPKPDPPTRARGHPGDRGGRGGGPGNPPGGSGGAAQGRLVQA